MKEPAKIVHQLRGWFGSDKMGVTNQAGILLRRFFQNTPRERPIKPILAALGSGTAGGLELPPPPVVLPPPPVVTVPLDPGRATPPASAVARSPVRSGTSSISKVVPMPLGWVTTEKTFLPP